MTNMPEHQLSRTIDERYEYELYRSSDGELLTDYSSGAYICQDVKATIRCACGERFRKDETALDHLEKHGE